MGDQGIQKVPGGIQIFRPGRGGTAGKKDRISDDFPYQMDHLTNRFGFPQRQTKKSLVVTKKPLGERERFSPGGTR